MDRAILEWVNGWPDGLEPVMRFLSEATRYGWFKVGLGLLVLAMLIAGGRARQTAIFAVLGFLLANELCDLLKSGLPAARPCQQLPGLDLHGIGCSDNPGTASAHSANMAAAAFAFTWNLGRWGIPWIVLALATGLSRMYVGAHYPYQVVFGWLVGMFAAFVLIATWRAYVRSRSTGDPEGDGEPA